MTAIADCTRPHDDTAVNDPPRIESIDEAAIRAYRAERIRQELHRRDREAVLTVDPVNLRYATGARNMRAPSSRPGKSRRSARRSPPASRAFAPFTNLRFPEGGSPRLSAIWLARAWRAAANIRRPVC